MTETVSRIARKLPHVKASHFGICACLTVRRWGDTSHRPQKTTFEDSI